MSNFSKVACNFITDKLHQESFYDQKQDQDIIKT